MSSSIQSLTRPPLRVLRIDASARTQGSATRLLTDRFVETLLHRVPRAEIVVRDLAVGIPLLDEDTLRAFRQADAPATAASELSDTLIEELRAADVVVVGVPIYNFSLPAALKAWIDLVARARKTYRPSEAGPVGLLDDKPVFVIESSDDTELFGPHDFMSDYLRHVFGALGLQDITFVTADRLALHGEAAFYGARDVAEHVASRRFRELT